ncbi:FGGY family carbohydrate kinase [Saccharopolyspora sp. NPDC002686]|uniref:FGGY-family carbohydrate kinase n=1 Tax=Saccharopolyspora sp. NPDC002686 TaxID=3154541 RepID=UPI003329D580
MVQTLLVGLDIGTTAVKAAVVADDGREIAHGRAATPWYATPLGTELDPQALLGAVWDAAGEALAAVPDGRVVGVGVTSMGEAGVLVDGSGDPVAPVIAWHDTRDGAETEQLGQDLGTLFSSRTGLPLRTQWSLTKHRWQVRNLVGAQKAVRRFNIAEWVVRALTGVEASDRSLASRTGWLDLWTGQWWDEAVEWSMLRPTLLPPLMASGQAVGVVSAPEAPPRLRGATVTMVGHDHQAAAVGAGVREAGDELDSCGSAEALVRAVPVPLAQAAVSELAAAGITVGWHVLPDRWCLLGATQGGLLMRRVLDLLGCAWEDLSTMDAAASAFEPTGIAVSDSIAGRVDITGIGDHASPGQLWRATVTAATEQAAALHRTMSRISGPHGRIIVTGGWSHSTAFIGAKQRQLGPLHRPAVAEAGARGAALVGGVAAGIYPGMTELPAPAEVHDEHVAPLSIR